MNTSIQRIVLSRMVAALQTKYPGCGVLVSGSVQRGEERANSDLDLFVVFPGDGAIRLEREKSPEGINADLALFPEMGFQREVKQKWYNFWMFSRAEIVHDPTGIAKRNQEIALSHFGDHPDVDQAWVRQLAEVRRHKADRSYIPEYPTWDSFSTHIEKVVAEHNP